MAGVPVAFEPRREPLEPLGVAATGSVAIALARRLLTFDDAELAALRGVASGDALVLLGESESLPWIDGVHYLGKDPDAPHLFMPTPWRANVASHVFERAISRHVREGGVYAILIDPPRVISVVDARPVARARLAAWLGART